MFVGLVGDYGFLFFELDICVVSCVMFVFDLVDKGFFFEDVLYSEY